MKFRPTDIFLGLSIAAISIGITADYTMAKPANPAAPLECRVRELERKVAGMQKQITVLHSMVHQLQAGK